MNKKTKLYAMFIKLKRWATFGHIAKFEGRRMARIQLGMILLFWIFGLLGLFVNFLFWQNTFLLTVILVGNLLHLIPIILLIKKRWMLSSFFLVSLYTIMTVSLATIGGGLHDYVVMLFPVIIMFAGLTAQQRGLIFACLLTLAGLAWLTLGEIYGLYVVTTAHIPDWPDFFVASVLILALTAILRWLVTSNQFGLMQTWRELDEHKRLETELRKLSQAVEQSPVSIMITDLDGVIEYVNPRFSEVTGYPAEDVLGKKPTILQPSNLTQNAYSQLWANLSDGKEWRGEFVNQRKDGSCYYESAVIAPITDENGKATHYLFIQKDITQRVETQQTLQESEARFRSLVNSLSDVIYTLDLEQRHTGVFGNWVEKSGNSPEFFLGKSAREIMGPQAAAVHEAANLRALAGQATAYEWSVSGELGEQYYQTVVSPILDENRRVVGLVGVGRNITSQKQIEQTLRESHARQHALFEHARDAILIADPQTGLILDANSQAEHLFAMSRAALIGKHQTELHPVSGKSTSAHNFGKHVDGAAQLFEDEVVRSDGQLVPVEVNASLVSLPNGKTVLQGIFRDITGRKRNEAMLQTRLEIVEMAAGQSLEECMQSALDKVAALAGSQIGFYHFVSEDQKSLSLQAWSSRTLQEFCKTDGKGLHYDVEKAGIWADCIRLGKPVVHNNYESHPDKKGLPPGHAWLERELVVPTYRKGRVVAILGVGNKSTDYLDEDVQSVAYLADVIWEIVQRKQVEQSLNEVESRLHLLSQNLSDAGLYVYAHDAQGEPHFEYLSPGMEALTGVKVNDALKDASVMHESILPEYLPGLSALQSYSSQALQPFTMEFRQRHALSGEIRWMLVRSTPRRRTDGSTVWYGVQIDVTERKAGEQTLKEVNQRLRAQMVEIEKLQETLREQALHDSLTGLYNRRYLEESLRLEIKRARRTGRPFSVVILDLDNLKLINDRFGHINGGDQALQVLATTLKKMCRESDTICRYGGDEFLILMYDTPATAALRRANEWLEQVRTISLIAEAGEFGISFSAGLTEYLPGDSAGENILVRADRALYCAKEMGRNRVECYIEQAGSV